jgi:hypothetical protein
VVDKVLLNNLHHKAGKDPVNLKKRPPNSGGTGRRFNLT